MLVSTSLVLGFVMLDTLSGFVAVWLHLMLVRPCLDVPIWDASPWYRLLHAYHSPFPLHAILCLPCLLVPLLVLYASLHACFHVHAWVLHASVSSMLQHNEVMDIWSKPTFVDHGHHLLFAFLLVCLLACLLASCFFAYHVYHAYLLYAFFTCPMHLFLSIACLLVSCSCLCMYTHGARTHRGRTRSLRRKQKGWGCKLVDIRQAVMFNSFRGLAFPIWLCTL